MLDYVVPVQWRQEGLEGWVGTPTVPLPGPLLLLGREVGHPGPDTPLQLASRRQATGELSLRTGWLYQRLGLVLFDVRCRYRPADRRLCLSPGYLRSAQDQLAATQDLARTVARRIGVGAKVEEPWIGPELCRSLGVSTAEETWLAAGDRVLTRTRPLPTDLPGLPDALVFHSDAPPSSLTLTLEATTACNFRCSFCYGRHLKQGLLGWPDFLTILDRVPGLQAVEFTGEGEPLLNRYLFDMLAECKQRGLWVHLSTNASLLDDSRIDRILELGVDEVAISLESVQPERFARLRPGGDLKQVLGALGRLAARSHGSSLQLILWVTLLRETLCEIDQIFAVAEELGIDIVEVQSLNQLESYTRFYDEALSANALTLRELTAAAEDPARSKAAREALWVWIRAHQGRHCDIFRSSTMVYWQGVATPCRLLKVPQHPAVGSLLEESFGEIWNQPDFRWFRFALEHGIVLRCCDRCPYVESA